MFYLGLDKIIDLLNLMLNMHFLTKLLDNFLIIITIINNKVENDNTNS